MDCVGQVGGGVVIYLFDEEKRKVWEARDSFSLELRNKRASD